MNKMKSIVIIVLTLCIWQTAYAQENQESPTKNVITDVQPRPQGGFGGLYKYIGSTLTYPDSAKRANIQGKVFLKFMVSKTGEIENVTAIKGIGYGCDEVAINVIKNSPKWSPGLLKGKPVEVWMTLPIVFHLNDPPKKKRNRKK